MIDREAKPAVSGVVKLPPFVDLRLKGRGMTSLRFVLCLLAFIVACRDSGPTQPTELPAVQVIRVGERVLGTFIGLSRYFELAAPKKGTLVAALTWSGTTNGTVLLLNLDGTVFRPTAPGRFPNHLTARLQVAEGQTVRIGVLGGGTDVTYDDPFVLATTLE